ncbi:MAG TPA: hypothetical protein VMT30_03535 [Candidatus Saccharimonadia bacterium]|nr:hypothetical protein [Candidatus Saccharimonadia bacterium]
MSRGHQIQRALGKAAARDRKRQKRMPVAGASVFMLRKLLRSKKS